MNHAAGTSPQKEPIAMSAIKIFNAGLFAGAVGILSAAVLSSGLPTVAAQQDPAKPTSSPPRLRQPESAGKTLFDRLGGTYPIAALVDDYINSLPSDTTIMGNLNVRAAVENAAANNGLPGLKYQVTAFLIEATGGPYSYHGRDMTESHKNLGITQTEWDASEKVLKASLDKFKVPAAEQAELNALIEKSHDQIVRPTGR